MGTAATKAAIAQCVRNVKQYEITGIILQKILLRPPGMLWKEKVSLIFSKFFFQRRGNYTTSRDR